LVALTQIKLQNRKAFDELISNRTTHLFPTVLNFRIKAKDLTAFLTPLGRFRINGLFQASGLI
jgi:hypothetical protein